MPQKPQLLKQILQMTMDYAMNKLQVSICIAVTLSLSLIYNDKLGLD